MKTNEQYFPMLLFFILYKLILTFESVDEILKFDSSNVSCSALLSCGAVCFSLFCNYCKKIRIFMQFRTCVLMKVEGFREMVLSGPAAMLIRSPL